MDILAGAFYFAFLCIGLSFATCAVAKEHGKWSAYSSCLIHHTPEECKGAKPP